MKTRKVDRLVRWIVFLFLGGSALVPALAGCTLLQKATPVPTATPVSGDVRIQDWSQTSAADFQAGERAQLTVEDQDGGELRLEAGVAAGVYTSTVGSAAFVFNALVAHWGADVPAGASLRVDLRAAVAPGGWSAWLPVENVEWAQVQAQFYPETPTLLQGGEQFQYRITMTAAPDGNSPVLREIVLTYMDTSVGPTTTQAKALTVMDKPSPLGVPRPPIISRAGWGADESYLDWDPQYRPVFKMVVHHTVTPNNYSEDQGAAWVRAIYYYHAVTREWGDIGYNYLVDQYGNVYEGRYGGPGVVGGHVYGYNYGSVGIGMIGTYGNYDGSVSPSSASIEALTQLCAWEASRSYIHPLESWPFYDASPPNLGGHRDYPPYSTSCPGDLAYKMLPALRQAVWQRLLNTIPKYGVKWVTAGTFGSGLPEGTLLANHTYTTTMTVRNGGSLTWPGAGRVNAVRLGYHWLDANGKPIAQPPEDDLRTPIDADLGFGSSFTFSSAAVKTPRKPGTYTLAWDMVHEGVAWFHDGNSASPLWMVKLTIVEAPIETPTMTPTLTPTVTPTPTPSLGEVVNGGFEQDGAWTIFDTAYPARYTSQVYHGGRRALQTGIERPEPNVFSYSSAEQVILLPKAGRITLSYWYRAAVDSGDHAYVLLRPADGDWQLLQITRQDVGSWTKVVHDLGAYRGQQITLRFGTLNDGRQGVSAMYVDDVVLQVDGEPSTATPAVTPSPTATPTPTPVSPTATPGACVELAVNGDFETGEGWVISNTPYKARYTQAIARTGARSLQLGMATLSENLVAYSSVEQAFAIPSGVKARLGLWYDVVDSGGSQDYGYFMIRPSGESAWRTLRIVRDRTEGWAYLEVDVSHYAGRTFTLRVGVRNDGSRDGAAAVMYVDSFSLVGCAQN